MLVPFARVFSKDTAKVGSQQEDQKNKRSKSPNVILIPLSRTISHIEMDVGLFATIWISNVISDSTFIRVLLFLLLRHLNGFYYRYVFFFSRALFPPALNYVSICSIWLRFCSFQLNLPYYIVK